MPTILLDPHGDDASLFAAFTCLRFRPLVVVTHRTVPFGEASAGVHQLGCQIVSIVADDIGSVASHLGNQYGDADHVFAPAEHPQGHEDHNTVAVLADGLFGSRVTHYKTYGPRGQRDRSGEEIAPVPSDWISAKLLALACFRSQIEQASTRPWFYELLDMREWVS